MLRSQAAKQLGIDIETIRFYENENLISSPERSDNGYRHYSNDILAELKFILHCRSLGISLKEIRLLKNIQKQSSDCSQANEIIQKNIQLIEKKIKDLKSLRLQLSALSKSCITPGAVKDCAIVNALSKAAKG
ncbi:MAG: transcriptional regulator [Oligoflexia bacterium]|nr:MAG: transcriptional regulator [Oligoflexia bacterium]